MENSTAVQRTPIWLWLIGVLGLAWNAFGAFQFFKGLSNTKESLMAGGFSEAAAVAYLGLPWWMTVAFGVGTLSAVLGCVLLMLRKSAALPVFVVSMIAYVILFVGDWTFDIFNLIPGQLPVLLVVELVAVVFLALAWWMYAKGAAT